MASVWTRNYTNALAGLLAGGATTPNVINQKAYGDDKLSLVRVNGSTMPYFDPASGYIVGWLPHLDYVQYRRDFTSYGTGIYLGTGDTAPDYDDIDLEAPVGGFSLTQSNVIVERFKYDETNHRYSTTKRFVLQYTGSLELTVKELGLYAAPTSSGGGYSCLMYREVFDTPVTLQQYESLIVEITQSFPLINYEPYPE